MGISACVNLAEAISFSSLKGGFPKYTRLSSVILSSVMVIQSPTLW